MKNLLKFTTLFFISIVLLSARCGGDDTATITPSCVTQDIEAFKGDNSSSCTIPLKVEEFKYNGSKIYKYTYLKTLLCADVPSVKWLDENCNILCTEGGGRGSNNCSFASTPIFTKVLWQTDVPKCILDKIIQENDCARLFSVQKYLYNNQIMYKLEYNLLGGCSDVPTLVWLNSDCSTYCFNGGIAGNMCNIQGAQLKKIIL